MTVLLTGGLSAVFHQAFLIPSLRRLAKMSLWLAVFDLFLKPYFALKLNLPEY